MKKNFLYVALWLMGIVGALSIWVVDASIYSVIRSDQSADITITYDANGWIFSGWGTTKQVTYTKDANDLYMANVNTQTPNKAWKTCENDTLYCMFDGWYTDTNYTTEWLWVAADTDTTTKTVYAKWIGFDDLDLDFGDTRYTIMDRNLWATDVAQWLYKSDNSNSPEDLSKIWKYYQWWNNYGFDNSTTIWPYTDTNLVVNTTSNQWWPGNYYSSATFIKRPWNNNPPYRWDYAGNVNLWWWSSSNVSDKQWPCPAWYHIPSNTEWQNIYDAFTTWKSTTTEWTAFCDSLTISKCFAAKLKLPFAGFRYPPNSNVVTQGEDGYYWSSTHYDYNNAYRLYFDSSNIYPQGDDNRVYGVSVRCLKDSPNPKTFFTLSFDVETNGGTTTATSVTAKQWTVISLSTSIYSASKAWYTFVWWNTNSWAITAQESITLNANTKVYAIFSKTLTGIYTATNASIEWGLTSGTCTMYNKETSCSITLPSVTCNAWYHTPTWSPANLDNITTNSWATASCTACGDGTYTEEWNTATSCTTCEAWYYCPSGIKTQCPLWYTSNAGASAESDCYKILTATFSGNGATLSSNSATCNLSYWSSSCPIVAPTITAAAEFDVVWFNTDANATDWITPTSISADITYYAITKSSSPIKVTFDVNGNWWATSTGECYRYNGSGSCSVTSPDITPAPGFTVIWWNSNPSTHSSEWNTGTAKTVSESATYYAQSEKAWYQVTASYVVWTWVSAIWATSGKCNVDTIYNGSGYLPCNITLPDITLKPGYNAWVWSTWNNVLNPWSGVSLLSDNTYTASATPNTYTVSYNANGGIWSIASSWYTYDLSWNLAENTFTKTWYVFSGWMYNNEIYTWNQEIKNLTGINDATITMVTQWKPIKYTVKFEAWEWTWTMANQDFEYDSGQALNANAFTRTGYIFSGWIDWTTGYADKQNVSNLTTTDGETVTLTAQWTPITYTISFSWNAADATWTAPDTINAEYDSGDIAPDNSFILTGYTFTGWNTESNGSGTWYATWAELKNLATTSGDDVMLYAQWEVNVHKLNFVVDWTTIQSGDVAYSGAISAPAEPKKDSCNSFAWWTSSVAWLTTTGTMPDSDVTFTANWNYTCSRSSGWWGGGSSRNTEKTTETQTWSKVDSSTKATDTEDNTQDSSAKASEWQNQWKTYSDEFQQAYEFAYKHGITTMPTIEQANMEGPLTRIAMAKMLSYYAINVLWLKPDETRVNKFNDVSDQMDAEYNNAVSLAYQLWIMWINMPKNNFRPNDLVTRAEFATALSRMLYKIADWKDKYYSTHLAKLMEEKIITNDNPNLQELRGYVMIMLMRSAK